MSYQQNSHPLTASILTLCKSASTKFCHIIKNYALFNLLFLVLCFIEIILILIFIGTLAKSSILAISFAILFLTLFSYLVIRLYSKAKKSAELSLLTDTFLEDCNTLLPQEQHSDSILLAKGNCVFASYLKNYESHIFAIPERMQQLIPLLQKISCWFFYEDVLKMQELLLLKTVHKHIEMIKQEPINKELHASLATVYIQLSELFKKPKQNSPDSSEWVILAKYTKNMHSKFTQAIKGALEEFLILKEYIQNDDWVHIQLAYCYHNLNMPLKEIEEYEIALTISPEDTEILYKLGVCYFEQSLNAKGLQIYEKVRHLDENIGNQLIQYYEPIRLD
ncbi:MAG: hypothetical protein P4L16_03615 [Chlamydiales bacterium]|nr:hypothetical protein [Chlamydiales bacterium]